MNGPRTAVGGGFQLPPVTPLLRNVLIALFVLYAAELVARNVLGLPIDLLAWHALGHGFLPFQPVTRYLVQGNGVIGVVLAGVVLYFFLPTIERSFKTAQWVEALLAGAVGGTVFALLCDLLGLAGGVALGWASLLAVLIVLFGLKNPDATILLFFVLPVPAKILAWGSGVLALLLFLATLDLTTADYLGTWAGAVGWWFYRGPGGRKRRLVRKARRIERELERFEVFEGGLHDPKDGGEVH